MAEPLSIRSMRRLSEERLELSLSDGTTLVTTLSAAAAQRCAVGRELSVEALEELKSSSALALCRQRALELLSRRSCSAGELADKLLRKGEAEENVAAVIEWLRERRYLDDAGYAAAVVRHYAAKGCGPARIRQELSRRRVPRELWDEAMEEMPADSDAVDRFLATKLRDPRDRDQVRKVSAALLRRGFGWEEIRSALRRLETDAEDCDE
ncbi:MAG: recombination regulator RecX [Oscillospiraceae bacterium]|nr:recombination regulator RecX [Oscillospiraceae bacterium]